MGVSCSNGGTYAAHSTCRTDGSRNFHGVVPPALRAFEDRVLRLHFGATLRAWEANEHYHAYHLVNVIAVGRTIPMTRIWHEYARRPAPTIGVRSRPIEGGERSIAMAAPTLGRDSQVPIPLPGGPVRHYVDRPNWALINATERLHVLHPGHIMRWIAQGPGSQVVSHTIGRGIGITPRFNETMGLEIFDDLDMRIRAAIR